MSKDEGKTPERVVFPMLPLRGVVVFPHQPMSLVVGRARSVAAVKAAEAQGDKKIFLVSQRNNETDRPDSSDPFEFGTVATLDQTLRLPDGNTKVLAEGKRRARVVRWIEVDGTMLSRWSSSQNPPRSMMSCLRWCARSKRPSSASKS